MAQNVPPPSAWHEHFLALRPTIRRYAALRFQGVRCPDRRADLVQETEAYGWVKYVGLRRRGIDPAQWPAAWAYKLAQAVNAGRRAAGGTRSGDVLSQEYRVWCGLAVQQLPALETGCEDNEAVDALAARDADPADRARMRIDAWAWAQTLTARGRRIMLACVMGERTNAIAAMEGITAGAVSQWRRALVQSWRTFQGE